MSRASECSAKVEQSTLEELSFFRVVVRFRIKVTNPTSGPVLVESVGYTLSSGGRQFAGDRVARNDAIAGPGFAVMEIPARVDFEPALSRLPGVRRGAMLPYLSAWVIRTADGRQCTAEVTGDFPVPVAPNMVLNGIKWESLSHGSGEAVLSLEVDNGNEFPVEVDRLSFSLDLEGERLVQQETEQVLSLDAGLRRLVAVRASCEVSGSLEPVLQRPGARYVMRGTVSGMTPFGPLDFPFATLGQTLITR